MVNLIIAILLFSCSFVDAALLYVDPFQSGHTDETWGGTNGQSYTSTADGFPGAGTGYLTVKAAIAAMSAGDKIYLRGGTYQEGHIRIPYNKDGTAWTEGNYNYIGSFPGEWAVIDGQNGGGTGGIDGVKVGDNANSFCAIGFTVSDTSGTYRQAYWKFERLEIKNGALADGSDAAGIEMQMGPVWIRYCYIHDNLASNSNNPGGVRMRQAQDSTIEYNWFKDNGALTDIGHNVAHINIYSDYNPDVIAADGFTDPADRPALARNTIRYNRFENGVVAIKIKQDQMLTGHTSTSGYSDIYNDYGDNIHHNIITAALGYAIDYRQDFAQVHHNIIDAPGSYVGIGMGETESSRSLYKTTVYNNTIIGNGHCLWFQHCNYSAGWLPDYHGYAYNNILSGCTETYDNSDASVNNQGFTTPDYSNFAYDRNFHINPVDHGTYDPTGTELISLELADGTRTRYTAAEWESYRAGTDLFFVDTPADLWASTYIPNGSFEVESGKTLAARGIGGNHPYLAGVTLPSFIGAVNPDDSDWVAGVIGLDVTYLTGATGDPTWIEGGTEPTPVPGVCGDESPSSTEPTENLCSSGTAGTVSLSGGNWVWICEGIESETDDSCSAQYLAPSTGSIYPFKSAAGVIWAAPN